MAKPTVAGLPVLALGGVRGRADGDGAHGGRVPACRGSHRGLRGRRWPDARAVTSEG